ncbi:MAG: HAD family phosphatase [Candidatus Micrarchaeota archaeon]|nr:HAD family phosphatase [Candidatus Micrarchaeota archaeon]
MIKLIIFDVGGVIDTFDESQYVEYISRKLDIDPKEFKGALIPMLDKMEVGKLNLVQLEEALSRKFGVTKKSLEWDVAFTKLNRLNGNVIKLIAKLSKKYDIAILTNVSRSRHIAKMERYLKNVKYDKMFTSCYLRMAKPDGRIYRFVLKKMNAKPHETIFVDNLKRNTDGARRVGIGVIQFTGYSDLVKGLKKTGIRW